MQRADRTERADRLFIFLLSLAVAPIAATPVTAVEAGAWPAFQNGGAIRITGGELPLRWGAEEGIEWEVELPGIGQSTPLVASDQIYVTSVSGSEKDVYHLIAIAADSGEQRWEVKFANPSPAENSNYVSRAAPTGVLHDDGVVAAFEGGLVVSVDAAGETLWRRNLVADYGPIGARHGLASSLERRDDLLYMLIERGEDPYLVALDAATGETRWKADGLGVTSWASPRLVATAWGDHLVCSGSGKIVGFDPENGNRLWEFDRIANNSTCTPMPLGENRFLIGASDGRGEENAGTGADSNGVIEISRSDDGTFAAEFVWRAEKASSSFGTPVAAAGSGWFVNRAGVLFRLDLETGENESTARVESGSVWATPLVTETSLYLFGQKGTTTVIDLESGRPVADNPLEPQGQTLYAVAAAPPRLYFRFGDRLVAVR